MGEQKQVRRSSANWSIQNILALSFTMVALTGIVIVALVLYLRFMSGMDTMARTSDQRIIDQVGRNLDGYLRSMMRISDTVYYRVIKNTDIADESIDQQMNLLYEANRDLLVSILLIDEDGALVSSAPYSKFKPTALPLDQSWFIQAMEGIENLHFSVPHVQNLLVDPDFRYRWVVSLSRAIELTDSGQLRHGVLLVDMNFSGIEQIFNNVSLSETGYVYLIDANGEIIYHPRQQMLYSNMLEENNLVAAGYPDGSHAETFGGIKRTVTIKTAGYTGWKIVGVTPVQDITARFYHLQTFAAFVLFFIIFLMVFANLFVSSRIADPIKALENSVKKLEEGDLDAQIAIGGSPEIAHLGMTISSMVTQMRKLMDEIVVEQESKRRSELEALQSQINPHFLYNTLDSIVWTIESGRYPEAISMVTALARLFRISLSKGKTIIPVRDELEHARNYMTIQLMRYQNKFVVDFDATPEAQNLMTIKLIVQPLLENAIYHGMEHMDGDGEIHVRAYVERDALYIDVTDNGMGIPPDTLATLLTDEHRTRSKGSGIGLRNVHQRVRLCYGPDYGLIILSEPDEGTTVRIRLPCNGPEHAETTQKEGAP